MNEFKTDILSLEFDELESEILKLGEAKFRAAQIFSWLHEKRAKSFDEMTNLSNALRQKLKDRFFINHLTVSRRLSSSKDSTVKYLYELSDGNHIETVLMEYEHGTSLCISTQVGCKMGCRFCASTIAGFKRNLEPSEMLLQIYETERLEGKKVQSLVLMGIGEPLDNFENTIHFLRLLSDKRGKNLSLRHVSVSTCGIVPRIKELAKMGLGITLSVSLHAANDKTRSQIMPINDKYGVDELIAACKEYFSKTGRRISFEYSVIDGVNDRRENAVELNKLLGGFNCHINIIPVNKIKERSFSSSRKSANTFKKYLENLGMNATVRRTLGSDIDAACGQLRREYEI
ncbi:MAG: 23S rRNA (adenine(2503)-C(2))-methyltransferase RlmN [Ruminococcus sp.]|nr:23S rRNA (adenine(2503)-C(2))-methyltransferase RlmN [Ruminococcus sp.]